MERMENLEGKLKGLVTGEQMWHMQVEAGISKLDADAEI